MGILLLYLLFVLVNFYAYYKSYSGKKPLRYCFLLKKIYSFFRFLYRVWAKNLKILRRYQIFTKLERQENYWRQAFRYLPGGMPTMPLKTT